MTLADEDGSFNLSDAQLFSANMDTCIKACGFIDQNMQMITQTLGLDEATIRSRNKIAVCVSFWSARSEIGVTFSKLTALA